MTDIPWTCITRVALEVQTSLDEPWTLDAMAGRAGYEAGHFAKTYHRIVGRPPVDHVRALRLERAAHALDTTDRSVTTVAMDAGFGSPDAFTRAFRRRFGCSPTSF
ncbi:MAG: helix-turn-helix transcriptional regulator, partial [Myxococcales bacterium]|nr:helix-turn-helix transcriptional regulator [Myxococcales bacterium]